MNNIIEILYLYLSFNALLAVGFLLMRGIVSMAIKPTALSKTQLLKLTRYAFIMLLTCILILPFVYDKIAISSSSFQFQPFIKHTTSELLTLSTSNVQAKAFPILEHSYTQINFTHFLLLLICISSLYAFVNYLKDVKKIKKIINSSFLYKQHNHISIVINENIQVPFCWSFFRKSVVCLPYACINDRALFNIYLSHELQHIRQHDTYWQHLSALMSIICFWNPAIKWWKTYFNELQEFACDEQLLKKEKTSPQQYTKALLTTAELAMNNTSLLTSVNFFSKRQISLLKNRAQYIINYQPIKETQHLVLALLATLAISFSTLSFALSTPSPKGEISLEQLNIIIEESKLDEKMNITANPELLATINNIITSPKAHKYIVDGLDNLKEFHVTIDKEINAKSLPHELIALPLAESGYVNRQASAATDAAGLWQFIPSTARNFGLVVSQNRDDRLNPELSSRAALYFIQALQSEFGNWQLVLAAYHLGPTGVQELVDKYQTDDIWEIIRKDGSLNELQRYLTIVNATMIIMAKPNILTR